MSRWRWATAAVEALERHRDEIDRINVFPVADRDTGTNLLLTMGAAVAELSSGGPAAEALARGALRGARGNSGVILSQLIRGAAEELASRPGELVDPVLVGAAMARAADRAYDSVREPAEGTILTVVREMAHRVASELAHMPEPRLSQGDDAVRLFLTLMIAHHQGGVEMADAALARTTVPQVVSMATGIQRSQSAEITVMQDLLASLPAP